MPALRDSLLFQIVVAWAVLAVLALLVWGVAQAPDAFWPAMLVIAAWPVGLVLGEWAMFSRRAHLAYATGADSHIRHWLARGVILRFGAHLLALGLVSVLVILAAQLYWQHWLALAVLLVVVLWGRALLHSRIDAEILPHARGYLIDRIAVIAGGAFLLGAGLALLDFLVIARPDTRAAAWGEVWEIAYADGGEGVRSGALGALFGLGHAAEMLAWHAAQTHSDTLGPGAALVFWLVFLTGVGLLAVALMVVVVAALQHLRWYAAPGSADSPFRTHFIALLSIMMAAAVIGHLGLGRELAREVEERPPFAAECGPGEMQAAMAEEAALSREFARMAAREEARVAQQTHRAVGDAFDALAPGIEAYLDWFYSLGGEYSRLGAAVVGNAQGYLQDAFVERVFGEDFATDLGAELDRIERDSTARIGDELDRYQSALRDAYGARDCAGAHAELLRDPLALVTPQPARLAQTAPGTMASAATAGVIVSARVGASAAARVASGSAFRVGAQALGRAAASRLGAVATGAGAGASVCLWGGPLAFVCGIGAAGVAWFTIDYGVLRLQELVRRDDMEAEIRAALNETRAETLAQVQTAQSLRITAMMSEVDGAGQGYVPGRDGIGPR